MRFKNVNVGMAGILVLIGDHFGVDVKGNGDHFRVGTISGSGLFRGLYRTLLASYSVLNLGAREPEVKPFSL